MKALFCLVLSLACFGALAAPGAWPDVWPKRGEIVFEVRQVSSHLVVGRNTHRWTHDGQAWSVRSITVPDGVTALFSRAQAIQESRGVFVPQGMQPAEFRTKRNGQEKDVARFDLATRQLTLGSGETLPFVVPTQDLLSLFYQLGAIHPSGAEGTLFMTTGRKLREYRLSAGKTERMETVLGPRLARLLTIVTAHQADENERTEVWLDTATRLPIKIRYRDRRGDVFDQVMTHMTTGEKL